MGRPLLPCEKVGAPATHILIVGSGFAGLAFARVLQWKDGHKLPRTLVTHIEISDEGAVAAGDIKLALLLSQCQVAADCCPGLSGRLEGLK